MMDNIPSPGNSKQQLAIAIVEFKKNTNAVSPKNHASKPLIFTPPFTLSIVTPYYSMKEAAIETNKLA